MAKIGIKGLTYATYSTGGEGSAITYTGGTKLDDYMIRADIGEEREDTKFHADDHQIDAVNYLNGATLALELANMTATLEEKFLGYKKVGTSSEYYVTDAAAPYVGCGFITKERFKGAESYKGYWFYKVQFSRDSDSINTKGESTEFQTETVNGNAMAVSLTSGGDNIYYSTLRDSTETAVRSWLNGKAGIS